MRSPEIIPAIAQPMPTPSPMNAIRIATRNSSFVSGLPTGSCDEPGGAADTLGVSLATFVERYVVVERFAGSHLAGEKIIEQSSSKDGAVALPAAIAPRS